jgi:hypothetical protein
MRVLVWSLSMDLRPHKAGKAADATAVYKARRRLRCPSHVTLFSMRTTGMAVDAKAACVQASAFFIHSAHSSAQDRQLEHQGLARQLARPAFSSLLGHRRVRCSSQRLEVVIGRS